MGARPVSVDDLTLLERKAWVVPLNKVDLFVVDVGFAQGTVWVKNDRVVETAPVFVWMKNRMWSTTQKWDRIISITEL